MEVWYACCCGIDVHAKLLVACVSKGGKKEVRTFSTMTEDLLGLWTGSPRPDARTWRLRARGCSGGRSLTFWKGRWT